MRKLKTEEYDLMIFMLKDYQAFDGADKMLSNAVVEEMNDGGMGSLRFLYTDGKKRRFFKEIAEASMFDVDQVLISFSINIDEYGDLFELDVFKGDFSPVKLFPKPPYTVIAPKVE